MAAVHPRAIRVTTVVALLLIGRGVGKAVGPTKNFWPERRFFPLDWVDCANFNLDSACGCTSTKTDGLRITITSGYQNPNDKLVCTACGAKSLTAQFLPASGEMVISGRDLSIGEYAEVLRSIRFYTTHTNPPNKKIFYNFGKAIPNPNNEHLYEYFPHRVCIKGVPGKCLWEDAQAYCADKSRDKLGYIGYLVTITTASEQTFCDKKLKSVSWLGGTDVGAEGTWRWVTGPEGCPNYPANPTEVRRRSSCDLGYPLTQTRNGCGVGATQCSANHGTRFTTGYQHWNNGEPNDWSNVCSGDGSCPRTGENFLSYNSRGRWNDFPYIPPASGDVRGFVCEWGGVGKKCTEYVEGEVPLVPRLNECSVRCPTCEDNVCSNAVPVAQTCVDPDPSVSSTGDWRCECPSSNPGSPKLIAETVCQYNECTEGCAGCNRNTCENAGQTCTDPTPQDNQLGDWRCTCPRWQSGSATAKAAVCKVNECTQTHSGCTSCARTTCGTNQDCFEPNDSAGSLSDWKCRCRAPHTGEATASQATCRIDECTAACSTCEGDKCSNAAPSQTCNDPNTLSSSTSDWICTCPPPSTITATAKAAVCDVNECIATCNTCNGGTCQAAGQTCNDPNIAYNSLSDWTCTCPPWQNGVAVIKVATCTVDECVQTHSGCTSCERDLCQNAAQDCVDPDTSAGALSNWQCRCRAPSTGQGVIKVAVCTLDECAATCNTCSGGRCRNAAPSQACNDPNTLASSLSDWTCTCPSPFQGVANTAAATCTINECTSPNAACTTCNKNTCENAGQTCTEPNTLWNSARDWTCKCPAWQTGVNTAAAAVCRVDECVVTAAQCTSCENNLCSNNGQDCSDPNTLVSSFSDWTCTCRAPATGQAITAVAVCEINECTYTCATCHGTAGNCQGQLCGDNNVAYDSLMDWFCQCPPPSTATALMQPADCRINECIQACPTCNGNVCEDAGQTCTEPNDRADSLSDWTCTCPTWQTGFAVAKAADCALDECDLAAHPLCNTCERGMVCAGAGQVCNDPVPLGASVGDWTCSCVAPAVGTAVGQLALCGIDECTIDCPTCEKDLCNTATPPQTCTDPDIYSDNTWMCECVAPLSGQAMVAVAACVLNECTATCNTCMNSVCTNGQTCDDPNTNSLVLGDWVCTCPYPSTGSQQAGPATCILDECAVRGCPTCADDTCNNGQPAQICNDPNPDYQSLSDWTCTCPVPYSGQGTTIAAYCTIDECTVQGCATCAEQTCVEQGQTCREGVMDADNLGDWYCDCPTPYTGSAKRRAAPCTLDECTVTGCPSCEDDVCSAAGQSCTDPNFAQEAHFDWVCICPPPTEGQATASVALCDLDECEATCSTCEGEVCSDAGQTCTDPGPKILYTNDWYCTCPLPSAGTAVLAVAPCVLDECVEMCPTCAGVKCAGASPQQECSDPDTSAESLSDWECICVAPLTGRADVRRAGCIIDECEADCSTCEQNRCAQKAQICNDPDTSASSLYDWTCSCQAPATGMEMAHEAICMLDECLVMDPLCETCALGACEAAGQTCRDPTPWQSSPWDWTCTCVLPLYGEKQYGAATCVIDECSKSCPTCAQGTCSGPGQICEDPDSSEFSLSDWTCTCPPPSSGMAVAEAARCYLDECDETCPTCENSACGVGSEWFHQQTCEDPMPYDMNLRDWECTCPVPASGNAVFKQAECTLDACEAACDQCENDACWNAGQQTCADLNHHPASLADWECTCPPPASGTAVGVAAVCEIDECTFNCPSCELGVCESAGQDCIDDDTGAENLYDWRCICRFPGEGEATSAIAVCSLDECDNDKCASCAKTTCSSQGQSCYDPDTNAEVVNDWTCSCHLPSEGYAIAKAADCLIKECLISCPSCAGTTCSDQNQTCFDPDESSLSLSDWLCSCPMPYMGMSSTSSIARCSIDECAVDCPTCDTGKLCEGAGQECVDPDQDELALSDWLCRCVLPSAGNATGMVADCFLNECDATCPTCAGYTCSDASQTCDDPETSTASLSDWTCNCVAPTMGSPMTAAPATCEMDECVIQDCWSCARATCTDADQVCNDLDPHYMSLRDWQCECIAPYTGERREGVAICSIDECTGSCPTCAGTTCSDAGQSCEDRDIDDSLGDWRCICPLPAVGDQVTAVADCALDECTVACDTCAKMTCVAAGQECEDPVQSSLSQLDWVCTCPAPSIGQGTMKAAQCTIDECSEMCPTCAGTTCIVESQGCIDADLVDSLGDWSCVCPLPAVGSAVATAAPRCEIDECTAVCLTCEQAMCSIEGQLCDDPNHDHEHLDDWTCRCTPPSIGTPARTDFATCDLNECIASCPTCAKGACGEQLCDDADTAATSLNDWTCSCYAPLSGSAVGAGASCELDECAYSSATPFCWSCAYESCANEWQTCNDPDTSGDSLKDWSCMCQAPLSGTAVAHAATCLIDECTATCRTCEEGACGSQACDDPHQDASSLEDWTCTCPLPSRGVAVTKSALCILDECDDDCPTCEKGVCAGQACEDPRKDLTSVLDWVCTCPVPGMGQEIAGAAACVIDECTEPNCDTCARDTCSINDQLCDDPDTDAGSLFDWMCSCVAPTSGSPTVGNAATCVVDECQVSCLTCAEGTCTDAGQGCHDKNSSAGSISDWECICAAPATGISVASVATCVLNECATDCITCAGANGDVCAAAGQVCVDVNTAAESVHDWLCTCPPPSAGERVGGPATCWLDECVAQCTSCALDACSSQNQDCIDPVRMPENVSDWYCDCKAPYTGSQIAAPAKCTLDECSYEGADCSSCGGDGVCAAGNSTCTDPVRDHLGDWYCTCPLPSKGTAVGKAVPCELDECIETCPTCEKGACFAVAQSCHDPNPMLASLSDWTCTCVLPATGSETAAPALCTLDECATFSCPSCAGTVCSAKRQDCEDPDTDAAKLFDWVCRCREPFVGERQGAPAQCIKDKLKFTSRPPSRAPQTYAPPTETPATFAPPTYEPPSGTFPPSPPTTPAPTVAESTGRPSTGVPSTGAPTTGLPSTGHPGSNDTGRPSTGVPTTGEPTTGVPLTGAPNTLEPVSHLSTLVPMVTQEPIHTDQPATTSVLPTPQPTSATTTESTLTEASAPPTPAPGKESIEVVADTTPTLPPKQIVLVGAPKLDKEEAELGMRSGFAATAAIPLSPTASGAAMKGVMTALPCGDHGDEVLPWVVNPLGLVVSGSHLAGALVGAGVLTAVAAAVSAGAGVALKKAQVHTHVTVSTSDYLGLLALPSFPLLVLTWLAPSLAYIATSMVITSTAVVGIAVILMLVGAGVGGAVLLTRHIPSAADYHLVNTPQSSVARFVHGPGEWVSLPRGGDRSMAAHNYASVLRPYSEKTPWFGFAEYAMGLVVGATAAVPTSTFSECGTLKLVQGAVFLVWLGLCAGLRPYHRPRDVAVMGAYLLLQTASCVVMAVGFYSEDPQPTYETGISLLEAAMVVLLLKSIVDVGCEVANHLQKRRLRLQSAAWFSAANGGAAGGASDDKLRLGLFGSESAGSPLATRSEPWNNSAAGSPSGGEELDIMLEECSDMGSTRMESTRRSPYLSPKGSQNGTVIAGAPVPPTFSHTLRMPRSLEETSGLGSSVHNLMPPGSGASFSSSTGRPSRRTQSSPGLDRTQSPSEKKTRTPLPKLNPANNSRRGRGRIW